MEGNQSKQINFRVDFRAQDEALPKAKEGRASKKKKN
jgi:hypothetical protein